MDDNPRIQERDGRLVADAGETLQLDEVIASLATAPKVWRQLEVEGGSEGILARRPVTAHSQGYVYDLWLVERLADRLGS